MVTIVSLYLVHCKVGNCPEMILEEEISMNSKFIVDKFSYGARITPFCPPQEEVAYNSPYTFFLNITAVLKTNLKYCSKFKVI